MKRFGEYIDTYKLMDAVHDGATLQILYEGKTADTALNDKHGFDTKFEDLFKDRSEEELLAIKKKYGATGDILEAEQRIAAIARDLVESLHRQHPAQWLQGAGGLPLRSWRPCAIDTAIEEALRERMERERIQARAGPGIDRQDRLSQGRGGDFLRWHQRAGCHSPRPASRPAAGMRWTTSASPSTLTIRTRI